MKGLIYSYALDIRAFTSCAVPPHLERLLLAEDNAQSTDLSNMLFRMQQAIGGAWTEYLHSDEELNPREPTVCPHMSVLQEWTWHTATLRHGMY